MSITLISIISIVSLFIKTFFKEEYNKPLFFLNNNFFTTYNDGKFEVLKKKT